MIATLVLASLLQGQTLPIADSRLAKRITLHEKFLSLSALGKRIQEATGVVIAVKPSIADRKISAFLEDQPVSTLMDRLSTALFLRFERDGQGYRLMLDPVVEREEANLIADELAASRKAARQALRDMVELGQMSLDDARREAKDLDKEVASDRYAKASPEDRAEITRRRQVLFLLDMDASFWAIGKAIAQGPPHLVDDILNGTLAVASSEPGPNLLKFPAEGSPTNLIQSRDGVTPTVRTAAFLRFDPESERLVYGLRSKTSFGDQGKSTQLNRYAESSDAQEVARHSRLMTRLNGWRQTSDRAVLETPLKPETRIESTHLYSFGAWSVAEQLEVLHRRSGVPILADAFRLKCSPETPLGGDTVAQFLKVFNEDRQGSISFSPGLIRAEGGWLFYRHNAYWRNLAREIPERVIAPIEAATNQDGLPSLEVASRFADSLTGPQETALKDGEVLVSFRSDTIREILPSLRLWARLDARQRQLVAGPGLAFDSLRGVARDRYVAAVQQNVIESFGADRYIGFLSPAFGPIPEGMGLFSGVSRSLLPANDVRSALSRTSGPTKGTVVDAFDLRFGTSRSDSFSVSFPASGSK